MTSQSPEEVIEATLNEALANDARSIQFPDEASTLVDSLSLDSDMSQKKMAALDISIPTINIQTKMLARIVHLFTLIERYLGHSSIRFEPTLSLHSRKATSGSESNAQTYVFLRVNDDENSLSQISTVIRDLATALIAPKLLSSQPLLIPSSTAHQKELEEEIERITQRLRALIMEHEPL